jgi:hypothetical protein
MLKRILDSSKPCHFDKLPDEVIVQIFSNLSKYTLSRCAISCKRLRRISYDESLWRRVDLGNKSLAPGVIGQVLARGASVIRLTKSTVQTPAMMNHFGFKYPLWHPNKLKYVDLSMASISHRGSIFFENKFIEFRKKKKKLRKNWFSCISFFYLSLFFKLLR